MNKLVIVESPSKSRTIEKYLGSGYKVTASMGHIMDLATSGKFGLGVDVENNFKPSYEPIKGKKTFINDLKKLSKNYDVIYLATDPDREGEAISWHLKEALNINDDKYYRVTFHEVTKDKIKEAFDNPGKINFDLVKSQETRRILDRIIGFRLSKLMQAKTSGVSAGRVQSVAVKLIVDREREILAFIPEEYWTITSIFKDFEAKLFKYKKDDLTIPNEEEADKIISKLSSDYKVESVEKKTRKRSAKLPFTTSSLQQESSNKLNFAAKRTMKIAQTLYEGVNLKNERVGLITYMRSDSTRLSDSFIEEANSYILKTYGDTYKGYVNKEKAKELAKKYIKIVELPEDYLQRSPFNLSGGQKRRVALAGILAMEPAFLILDEPTAGLDPYGVNEMLQLFYDINQKSNTTIIIVTHDLDNALR